MFNKKNQETKSIGKIETIVGPDSEVKGTIFSKGSIRVDGIIDGGIIQADAVIVGETGVINGNVNAQMVVIGGKISGNVASSSAVEILENGELKGDIKSPQISIREGALFDGNCTMVRKEGAFEERLAQKS